MKNTKGKKKTSNTMLLPEPKKGRDSLGQDQQVHLNAKLNNSLKMVSKFEQGEKPTGYTLHESAICPIISW